MKNAFSYVEVLSVILSMFLIGAMVYRISQNAVSFAIAIPTFLCAFLIGYLISDFLSGIAHWLLDRYGQLETPVFGQFILFFRVHHLLPKEMTKHNIFETIGSSCFAINILLALFMVFSSQIGNSPFFLFVNALILSCGFWLITTNYFHKMAHVERPPKLFQLLQRFKIILPPKRHRLHHTPPYETCYCITSGWCNPFLTKIRFFERVENVIYRLTGVKAGQYDLSEIRERMVKMLNEYNHQSDTPSKNP